MSLPEEQSGAQVSFGRDALRRLREQQAAAGQGEQPQPDPAPPRVETGPPAPLPSGIGFAVLVPLHSKDVKRAYPYSVEDALTISPREFPETLVIRREGQIEFWYLITEPLTADAEQNAARDAAWRVRKVFRYRAAARGWAIANEHGSIGALPADSNNLVRMGADAGYSISDLNSRLDQAGIPTREQDERNAAELRERFCTPVLIVPPDDLVIDPDAALDPPVLQRLLDGDQEFSTTWMRQRADVPHRIDAYERELTRMLSGHKLGPQQIVNAIIQWRRQHGMKLELRERHFRQLLSKEWRGTAEPIKGTPQQRRARRDRRQLCVAANDAEQAIFEEWARREGQTVSNMIRLRFGMPPTYAGRPDPIQDARREDWIYETLQNLGIDPTPYFPEG